MDLAADTFLPDHPGLRLDHVTLGPGAVTMEVAAPAPTAECPCCGRPSARIHSRYVRTVRDLPWQGRTVTLRLTVRKFLCRSADCARVVFCERLPEFLSAHARTTDRQTDAHRLLGFVLGGEAGARVAEKMAMPTSPDTLLRRVKDAPGEPTPAPRVVGVDDWALRKGQHYGTILIDLERGRVIDILPGRDGEALKAWLKEHPDVEVISRDRWAAYAQAAAEGAPQAQQVADRWHLLKNLREAVERLLERRYDDVKGCLKDVTPADSSPPPTPEAPPSVLPTAAEPAPPTPQQQARQAKRQRRVERYERVRALHRQGKSARGIARELGMSVRTILRYLREGQCPDWKPGQPRPNRLDPFRDYIDRRIQEGCRNAAALHRELADLGCRVSASSVRTFVSRCLAAAGQRRERANAAQPPTPKPPSARALSFEFLRRAEDREVEEQARLEALRDIDAELTGALELAATFAAMARKQVAVSLAEWLAQALPSCCPEIRRFAEGIRQDEAAVAAALTEKWSNGPVEGQVNRLKLIKRSMFGRAGFQLLRARVLHAG
jgi:transposase